MSDSDITFDQQKVFEAIQKYYEGKSVEKISLTRVTGIGGLSSDMHYLKATIDGNEASFIVKSTKVADQVNGKSLGKAREALFYSNLYKDLENYGLACISVLYSEGDIDKCIRVILMEDISSHSVQSGYLFGKHSPHNFDKDLESILAKCPKVPTQKEAAISAYLMALKFHKFYWNDSSIFSKHYLKASDWYSGLGEDLWNDSHNLCVNCWKDIKIKIANNEYSYSWDPEFVEILDSSLGRINWNEYQKEIKSKPFTVIHGDFHPANIMWSWGKKSEGETIILDWEQVGIGFAGQDLGQYLISHVEPSLSNEIEKDLLDAYYKELIENRPDIGDSYSFENLYRDFVEGGSRRFIWLLIIIVYYFPSQFSKYFHDQVYSFCKDHQITKDNVGMPLV